MVTLDHCEKLFNRCLQPLTLDRKDVSLIDLVSSLVKLANERKRGE